MVMKSYYELDTATWQHAQEHFLTVILEEMLDGRFPWDQLGSRRVMIQAQVERVRKQGDRYMQKQTLAEAFRPDLRRVAQRYAQRAHYLGPGEHAVALQDLTL
jgi:hypothetical protein